MRTIKVVDDRIPEEYNIVVLLAKSLYMHFKDFGVNTKFSKNKHTILLQIIYEKAGFDFNPADFDIDLGAIDIVIPTHHFINSTYFTKILDKVKNRFGEQAKKLFWFSLSIFTVKGVFSVFEGFEEIKKTETDKESLMKIKVLISQVSFCFHQSVFVFNDTDFFDTDFFQKYFHDEFIAEIISFGKLVSNRKKLDINFIDEISDRLTHLLVSILPDDRKSYVKLEKGLELIRDLKSIKPGNADWQKYEQTCMEILTYLFIPTFKIVYFQVRTENGYERRDAIIPNHAESFFWSQIRQEFDSKNIVCEFKNVLKSHNKETINQLRIYLSKPTIGRFGLLFLRKAVELKGLLQAQHDAYSQNNILILIVDDQLIEKMIYCRSYFDSCDSVLESEKMKFELAF